ncbi:DUF4810 domain-containing protein [Aquabacterium sp. A7-Y]|uniref:DUF4810 domain-containing protein n=1 Tax=Aquabacterium sp. A7-Y TaxID=1349605 RepID=UPI00223D191E|nr:DUF4810 domain-containing protein [Aquabacterium sp. A7-Y]MCW7537479.1 DUF4810 domain-containing protein [Aquabacterium sp. A7-Y]
MSRSTWARRLLLVGAIAVLAGCANRGTAPLYLWESFPRQQYQTLLREGSDTEAQIRDLEAHAEKARGSGAALPPGFRAHLGMLHLSVGNADQARQLWQAEKAAFPESAPYMDQLLKRLDAPVKTSKNEKPA